MQKVRIYDIILVWAPQTLAQWFHPKLSVVGVLLYCSQQFSTFWKWVYEKYNVWVYYFGEANLPYQTLWKYHLHNWQWWRLKMCYLRAKESNRDPACLVELVAFLVELVYPTIILDNYCNIITSYYIQSWLSIYQDVRACIWLIVDLSD